MGLKEYHQKRDLSKTPEPGGTTKKKGKKLRFVIQRHHASHLHYDLRLEMEGVLKSWAVPKGPSLNPSDKRLAMMVEDHPYDYRNFEGEIPAGNYGAGVVHIWDEGYYHPIGEFENEEKELLRQLKAGNLKFVFEGKKLKGEFALFKIKGNEGNAWLLVKHRDQYAVDEAYSSEDYVPAKVKNAVRPQDKQKKSPQVKKKPVRKPRKAA